MSSDAALEAAIAATAAAIAGISSENQTFQSPSAGGVTGIALGNGQQHATPTTGEEMPSTISVPAATSSSHGQHQHHQGQGGGRSESKGSLQLRYGKPVEKKERRPVPDDGARIGMSHKTDGCPLAADMSIS
jgi:hypothetical protein